MRSYTTGRLRSTSIKTTPRFADVQDMFKRAIPVGEGAYGEVRSYNSGNERLILKHQHQNNKAREEAAHLEIWNRMTTDGRRSCNKYITKPYKSLHPRISIQQSAIPKGYLGMPLHEFLQTELKKSHARVKELVTPVIISEVVSALSCLHHHGVVHSDVKFDNFVVYYKPDNPLDIRVKIIDMGLAALSSESKPLITLARTPDASFLNTTKLEKLLRRSFSQIANNGRGLFANTVFVRSHRNSLKPFDQRHLSNSRGAYVEEFITNHLSVHPNKVRNALYDLYELEDKQARKLQRIIRRKQALTRKRTGKIDNSKRNSSPRVTATLDQPARAPKGATRPASATQRGSGGLKALPKSLPKSSKELNLSKLTLADPRSIWYVPKASSQQPSNPFRPFAERGSSKSSNPFRPFSKRGSTKAVKPRP